MCNPNNPQHRFHKPTAKQQSKLHSSSASSKVAAQAPDQQHKVPSNSASTNYPPQSSSPCISLHRTPFQHFCVAFGTFVLACWAFYAVGRKHRDRIPSKQPNTGAHSASAPPPHSTESPNGIPSGLGSRADFNRHQLAGRVRRPIDLIHPTLGVSLHQGLYLVLRQR